MSELYDQLCEKAGKDFVNRQEPMSLHTTFRVGGPAAYYVKPQTEQALIDTICFLRGQCTPFYILGNGSNLLVSDTGYEGVVIEIGDAFDVVSVQKDQVTAQAGALLSKVARAAYQAGLTGLEFAAGIPGTLGGGVVMNAGAYGGELKDVIQTVTLLDAGGALIRQTPSQLHMAYRTSDVTDLGYTVLQATFCLSQGAPEDILQRMEELSHKRRSKQPLEYPSGGSTFKRPQGYFAGQLIEQAGLKGLQVGGAQVSEKHCGFVINKGNATASDIMDLCTLVRAKVKAVHGVELELELKTLGSF